MKTSRKTYYMKKGGRITEREHIRIDGFSEGDNNAPPEPVIWQHPIILAPTLFGCDGDTRHLTEIECLVRYAWARGFYICFVQEAGVEQTKLFLQKDVAKWLAQLEEQIGEWLCELYGGTLERFPVALDDSIPPPDEIDQLVDPETTVYLIDGDLANIACPATESIPAVGDGETPLDGDLPSLEQAIAQDSASMRTPAERCALVAARAGKTAKQASACIWDELGCPGCPYGGTLGRKGRSKR